MPKKILVASPHPAFGELIRLSLEEGGTYRVRLVQTCEQVLECTHEADYDLAILDCDIIVAQLTPFLQELYEQHPGLQRILIPPDNNPNHPALSGVNAAAFLNKPFYLPDLLETLDRIFAPKSTQPVISVDEDPTPLPELTWLHEADAAETALARALPDTTARGAALLLDHNYLVGAGSLDEIALRELAQHAAKAWNDGPGDLARYVNLAAAGNEVLLFARALSGRLLMALAYEPSTPLTRMRAQASALADTLSTPQVSEAAPTTSAYNLDELDDEPGEVPGYNLDELLASMPDPDPQPGQKAGSDWMPEDMSDAPPEGILLPWEVGDELRLPSAAGDTVPSSVANTVRSMHLAETRKNGGSSQADQGLQSLPIEFVSPAYTCVLLPARPEHLLAGTLADLLQQSIPQLCAAFGWKLENLLLQTNYVSWTVRLQPAVSPSYLVRLIRKQTSAAIFHNFPQYEAQLENKDFWAPGFLIISGAKTPQPDMLNQFIIQTRRRQGFPLP